MSKSSVRKMMNNVMRCGGTLKLLEEISELGQVAAKLAIIYPKYVYYDGSNLVPRLEMEMGDVLATMEYVVEKLHLDENAIKTRSERKLKTYKMWEVQNSEGGFTNDVQSDQG